MSTPVTPTNPSPAGDDRNLVAVDPTTAVSFEDKMQLFWKKNRNIVFAICVLVLLGIVGKEGWDYLARQKELEVEKAYAAVTTPEQLKSFAAAHSNHSLAGVAHLRMGDDAYKAGKPADAAAAYDRAIAVLKTGPLVSRAEVGRALAKMQSGKAAEGHAELKKIADDANQPKAVRAETSYHLTSLAVEAGNASEAQKYVEQLMKLDATSPWTQRALSIRATLPAEKPVVSAEEKKSDAAPGVQLKIPTK